MARSVVRFNDLCEPCIHLHKFDSIYCFSIIRGSYHCFSLSYPDEGVLWVTTAETNKKTTRSLSFGWPVSEQWHYGDVVRFNLYARGKQYMRCEEEEDVSLETKVLSGDIDNPDGWEGTLVCYDVWPDGTMTLVALHPIG